MLNYHVDFVCDLFMLVAQLPHDVITGILGLISDSVHAMKTVRLILGPAVEVEQSFSIRHIM